METTVQISIYYQRVINLLLQLHHNDLSKETPGHCMKITGLATNELVFLWGLLQENYPKLNSFIVGEEANRDPKYISATKLIELRNQQDAPLLILIPSNSRTAAEDSYGNATFKEISLDGMESHLKRDLLNAVPVEYRTLIEHDIIGHISSTDITDSNIINYLLELESQGYSRENIGKFLYLLKLIPDTQLLEDREQLRSRLTLNIDYIADLCTFSKPLFERVSGIPIPPNTIQQKLVAFIKAEKAAKDKEQICSKIAQSYPELDFAHWPLEIPDISKIKLVVDRITSRDFFIEDGQIILKGKEGKTSKITVRFTPSVKPKDHPNLKFFRIVLYKVDGENGEEIISLRKAKKTTSSRKYVDITVEINPNTIEQTSYFLKVLAEDEFGNILNADDEFKEKNIQDAWEEAKEKDPNAKKSDFPFKLSCDSEDFHFTLEEEIEEDTNRRKDKIQNTLQAYFKFRFDKLKRDEELLLPEAEDGTNVWLKETNNFTSTFHIRYSDNHNYQVNLSKKLRILESEFLKQKHSLGYIKASLSSNSATVGFDSILFIESKIKDIVPKNILELREEVFTLIQESPETKDGVFESCKFQSIIEPVKQYLAAYTAWTSELNSRMREESLSKDEQGELQHFLTEIQFLDQVKVRTQLPDKQHSDAILLSPLHPLRLAWFVQLYEVFSDWEKKTVGYKQHIEHWKKNLAELFDGGIYPENNPMVFVEPGGFRNFQYAGELCFGWGIYLNVLDEERKTDLTSVTRQLRYYYRQLLNISKENYIETDLTTQLVVRHLRNYLVQHPYTSKLTINLVNPSDASTFADAFVELEKDKRFQHIKYEVCIFRGDDNIVEHGEALKQLINPEFNVSEEAEAFSQPSKNRLFPKLRFSINSISDYLKTPSRFTAHITFLISPFPLAIELEQASEEMNNFFLNGLLTETAMAVDENEREVKWSRYISGSSLEIPYGGMGNIGIDLFNNIQTFVAGALKLAPTSKVPATTLRLRDKDQVLLNHIHDYSDWVVTFDKNIGPQIFDKPAKEGKIPFLLDYVPGEEVDGVSSYLTTRPNSEVLGLLGPHFQEFDIDIHKAEDERKIKILLEDLRAISSSIVLQLNSTKNKAFEVIGSAFTKRILEKKGYLKDSFLIPIDLHQNLFEELPTESKSRADNLLVSINLESREIEISVIEIKCRSSLHRSDKEELQAKMLEQMQNTIEALKFHFDPERELSYDRLDREIKNKELAALLRFYIERAYRYNFLDELVYPEYLKFVQKLDQGFRLRFNQLGFIYDFSTSIKHQKETRDDETVFFTIGAKLIKEILDPDSDLNTQRLEDKVFDEELSIAFGKTNKVEQLLKKFKLDEPLETTKTPTSNGETIIEEIVTEELATVESAEPPKTEQKATIFDESEELAVKKEPAQNYIVPEYDVLIGSTSESEQYGILGESIHGKKIAIDLSGTNTVSLFGVQGGGKSYTVGTLSEMVLKQFSNINQLPAPLAGVIFHYSESMDYEPEFTSMIYPNTKEGELQKLKDVYGADPDNIEDVILLAPQDKVEERKEEYPSIEVHPIAFNSKELNVQDWMFLLGAIGNDSAYIKQLKAIMKEHRRNITIDGISQSVEDSELLSNSQKALARQKLNFAREYINDEAVIQGLLKPGRLIIVDLRDEFIVKDEALGLFVIMLNIFSAVKSINGNRFNKFIVFDEAHKYMDNKDLTGTIVTAIREMRHKGVSIMIASQDPPSLPNEIIELSSVVLLHKFNSPQWLKHIQKSITQLSTLSAADMSALNPGEGFLWATKATEKSVSAKPVKVSTRPRVTLHGGGTVEAT